MLYYLLRRILYMFPILVAVNLLTFMLFFMVNTPEQMARLQLGHKYITQQEVNDWLHQHHYDMPFFYNHEAKGKEQITQTLFYAKSLRLFSFDFGQSLLGRDIGQDIKQRMGPSLVIAIPTLLLGLLVHISLALILSFFYGQWLDRVGLLVSIMFMSISGLFYIIAFQYLFGTMLRWFPISGYESGWQAWHFVLLPILIGVFSGLGTGVRWYRNIFLEERHKEYVKTAQAKGLSDVHIWVKHIFPNGLLPIVTGVVALLPLLFMGSLLMESFFSIPGLGSYTIDAIGQQDFEIVRVMVFLGSMLTLVGLLLTDIVYAWVDPRIRFQSGS
jgi:peptide/nickel transport system permease protein